MKRILLVCLLTAFCSVGFAQEFEIQHDKQKEKQWKSMETGPWEFAPGWFYWITHKNYSGAELHWAFFGSNVKFKESKSNVKRIMPTRTEAELLQSQRLSKVKQEEAKLKELYEEDVKKQVDRAVDLQYKDYKADFDHMQEQIAEGLSYCLAKSKGKLAPQVRKFTRRNEVICQNIAYIHKEGVGYELENAKRQKAYAELKEQMKDLMKKTRNLMILANANF